MKATLFGRVVRLIEHFRKMFKKHVKSCFFGNAELMERYRLIFLRYNCIHFTIYDAALVRHVPVFIDSLKVYEPWIYLKLKDSFTNCFRKRSLSCQAFQRSIWLCFTPILFLFLVLFFILEALIIVALST